MTHDTQAKKCPGTAYAPYLHARLWINNGQNDYLGIGRIQLLEAINRTGSIKQASESMHLSYRKAMHLVEAINHMHTEPLILRQKGGKGGGGAHLSDIGIQYIHLYRDIEHDMKQLMQNANQRLQHLMPSITMETSS